ncbi:MAG TPA: DUF5996 family protein, partial [Aquihabitans sp.]|nr:DUF5996 family protein [Aquihabitans sp.]
ALHLWSQVAGKVRLQLTPWLNHSWSVTLYVSPSGLRTSLIPYGGEGVELAFDLLEHQLLISTTEGRRRSIPLRDGTVADFHAEVLDAMAAVGMPVRIDTMPNEIPDAVRFDEDTRPRTYVPEHAHALWRGLLRTNHVLGRFRAGYRGKASPVHLFWGAFDLATTRFSGRTAPEHPGGMPNFPDDVAREAYSHEVTSAGFWPGNRDAPAPIFYSYAYPTPDGFAESTVQPDAAFWLADLGEFALPYDALLATEDPDATLLAFYESTHHAAAELAGWDREALECQWPHGPDWWATRPERRRG